MSYNFCDEYGRPYILIKEQETRRKVEENNVLEGNVRAFCEIADSLRTSLGPFGADKSIISADGEVTITNDGATILKEMDVRGTPMGRLVTQLSASQDDEIGDGTTSVVIIAAALLKEALKLKEKGMHPLKIIRGYEEALEIALKVVEKSSHSVSEEEMEEAIAKVAKSTLSSKIVSRDMENYIKIAAESVEAVTDRRGEANLELIKIEGEISVEKSELIRGVYISKELSHFQMEKQIEHAKIALLACPLEPPKVKAKHDLNIEGVEEYKKLVEYEKKVFSEMVEQIKNVGANVVLCQWGFDDEANSLLLQNGISAIRWVGAQELEMTAIHCGAQIISRFEDLKESALGTARVTEHRGSTRIEHVRSSGQNGAEIGGEAEREDREEKRGKAVTILVRGGTHAMIEEIKRSVRDVLCSIRNIRREKRIVRGAGRVDLECAQAVFEQMPGSIGRAYGRALQELPMALASNEGEDPIARLSEEIAEEVWEGAHSKKHQYIVATQTVKAIVRIDDVFEGK